MRYWELLQVQLVIGKLYCFLLLFINYHNYYIIFYKIKLSYLSSFFLSKRNFCTLPQDLKSFYMINNVMNIEWKIKLDSKQN